MRSKVLWFYVDADGIELVVASAVDGRRLRRVFPGSSPMHEVVRRELMGQEWDTYHSGGQTLFHQPIDPDKPRHEMKTAGGWVDLEVTQHHDEMPKAPPATRKPEVRRVSFVRLYPEGAIVACKLGEHEEVNRHYATFTGALHSALISLLEHYRFRTVTGLGVATLNPCEFVPCPFCGGSDA